MASLPYHTTPEMDPAFAGTTCIKLVGMISLNPQWVLAALPKSITKKPITRLHEALSTQEVDLQVELTPLKLKLADIIRLHVGDVIKTDHPITEPAKLPFSRKPSVTSTSVNPTPINPFK